MCGRKREKKREREEERGGEERGGESLVMGAAPDLKCEGQR